MLLTLAVCSYLLEEAPFSCHSAQLLAINDEPRQHRILVRYYRSLGFRKVRDVGDGLGDLADLVGWGGTGTLMEVNLEDFMRRNEPALRAALQGADDGARR